MLYVDNSNDDGPQIKVTGFHMERTLCFFYSDGRIFFGIGYVMICFITV